MGQECRSEVCDQSRYLEVISTKNLNHETGGDHLENKGPQRGVPKTEPWDTPALGGKASNRMR